VAECHATAAIKLAKKFCVFHQRHLRKSANVKEDSSPAEYPVVAASHSKQDACIMRKAIRESINQAFRQANSEVTANHGRIIHDMLDLIQTSLRDFGVDMQKPKDVANRSVHAGVHLYGPIALASNKLIAKARGEISGAVTTSAVHDNNLSSRRSLAQMPKKWPYQRSFAKNRNDDRDLCSKDSRRIARQMPIMRLQLCGRLHEYGSATDHRLIFAQERL
jgi:hypothetical protein